MIAKYRLPAAFALMLAVATFAASEDLVLPDGKGRDKVENACTVCHSADRIMKQRMTVDQWRSEVRTMVENGASLNPDEWEPVVAYLAKHFGPPVNMNTATAKQIAEGSPFTIDEAEAIVVWRQTNGPYKEIKDLKKVPNVDEKKIEAQQTRIKF